MSSPQAFIFITRQFMSNDDQSVARWEMRDADDRVLSEGMSNVEYGPEGMLQRLTNFFETPD